MAICLSTYLQVTKLGELLSAVIEFARKRLDLLVHNLVGADISSLSERLATNVTIVWPLSSVPSLVRLLPLADVVGR